MDDWFEKPDKQASADDIASDLEHQFNDFSMNMFVNELIQNTLEGVTQDIADEQSAEAIVAVDFAKLTRQKLDNASMESVRIEDSHVANTALEISESDEESDFEDLMPDRLSSVKFLRSIKQVEPTVLPSSSRVFSETNDAMAISRLYANRVRIMDDWFEELDDATSEDYIISVLDYQFNDFYMSTFVNEFEGVTQDIVDEQTYKAVVTSKYANPARQKMDNVSMEPISIGSSRVANKAREISDCDDESDFKDFVKDRMFSVKFLQPFNQVEPTTLPSTRRVFYEVNDAKAKPQILLSESEGPGHDLRIGGFHVVNKVREMSDCDVESDFEDFRKNRLSSVKVLRLGMQVDPTTLQSTRQPSFQTNDAMAKPTQLILSESKGRRHGLKSSILPSAMPRIRSDSCLHHTFKHNTLPLNKALSDTNMLNINCTSVINDFPKMPFDKLSHQIAQSDKVHSVNPHPTTHPHKVVNTSINTTPATGVSAPIDTTPATEINTVQHQVPCKNRKKPSFIKHATSRISGALQGMTRLFTSCKQSRITFLRLNKSFQF